ncbi:helix-turn-helix domain containing protein [Phenylobacterium sp. LjRoot219]|uniref:helix-turn-helix domain-containing protein n=1 Tax=Phenylobacterium sp. LjRoot219 TaxID=3342283 RepID=UPI003ED063F8
MTDAPKRRTRNIAEKRARIIAAAQILFTQKGYSQASIKEIADHAEVAAGLVIKHFDSKLKLFEAALIAALAHSNIDASDKAGFGMRLAEVVLNKETKVVFPAMVMLSIEDEEARRVAMAVFREHGMKPTERWLGGALAAERAVYINLLGVTLSLLDRLFGPELQADLEFPPVQWIVESIQRAVDVGETDPQD